ncbi:MAG: hypothetical protein WD068_03180 [Candidatus Babeliales bacterium]
MIKKILLKITGTSFLNDRGELSSSLLRSIARQIQELSTTYQFNIVMGAGNFFRGSQQGKQLGLSGNQGHQIGMLATGLNGLILQDIFAQEGIATIILTAFECPTLGQTISPTTITDALTHQKTILFIGGTGNPYFSTDTAAIIRGLQIGADQIWKATHIDGIYDHDPRKHPAAKLLRNVSYEYALQHRLAIMDATAFALAQEHDIPLRVFNIFEPDALLRASKDPDFGSTVR